MKKYHGVRKIKLGIPFQLFAISYLSFCIVAMATSSTTASFHSETRTLERDILAADTFTESTDDADKPSKEDEAEENEEDENEEQEIDTEEEEEDAETTGDE
ncbi:hypothetical protein [Salicibibacter kimchii]|uniref:Uncharacterized protein n=1 Tax=Salicibibacter kimchii TaxID=2099786 RepID=A0A345BY66_9BACI|nr:hypothetical protein [Salicibibacter kimchii]AXF55897.1 hypothetical protein DT065_07560 [Salicibibacter kimchii]